jgi:hypothetical protein
MKRFAFLLAVILAVGVLAGPVMAQRMLMTTEEEVEVPRLRDETTSDSTSFTITNAAADTSAWFDMGKYLFPPCTSATMPLLQLSVMHGRAVGDTLGIVTEWSNDNGTTIIARSDTTYLITPSTMAPIVTCSNYFGRYVRWTVVDVDKTNDVSYAITSMYPAAMRLR